MLMRLRPSGLDRPPIARNRPALRPAPGSTDAGCYGPERRRRTTLVPTDCGNATVVRRADRGLVTPEWHADRRSRPAFGARGIPTAAAESERTVFNTLEPMLVR